MKGHKLTLEEVLRLEDGTKVWVEDRDEGDEQVGTIVDEDDMLKLDDGGWFYLSDLPLANFVTFYEWIEESDLTVDNSVSIIGRNHTDIIEDMATEICNLRGINLADDNIRLIVEEFSK